MENILPQAWIILLQDENEDLNQKEEKKDTLVQWSRKGRITETRAFFFLMEDCSPLIDTVVGGIHLRIID